MTDHKIERGLFYEDFEIGQTFEHHWGRTLTQTDGCVFANMYMQMNPAFFNRDYAQELGYEDMVLPPMFLLSTVLGLSVEDLSEAGGPFLGVDDVRFGRAVLAGETIYAHSSVEACRLTESRPGWGIVEWHTRGLTTGGEEVLSFRRRNLSRCRPI